MKRKISFKNVYYAVGLVFTVAVVFLNISASTNLADKKGRSISLSDLSVSTQSAAACPESDIFTEAVDYDCYNFCNSLTWEVIGVDEYGNPIKLYTYREWTDKGFYVSCEPAFTFSSCTEANCNANCIEGDHEI